MKNIVCKLILTLSSMSGAISPAWAETRENSSSHSSIRVADLIHVLHSKDSFVVDPETTNFMKLYHGFLNSSSAEIKILHEQELIESDENLWLLLKSLRYPTLRSLISSEELRVAFKEATDAQWELYGPAERDACNAACSREFIQEVKDNVSRSIEKGDVVGAIVEIIDPKSPIENGRACYAKCAGK